MRGSSIVVLALSLITGSAFAQSVPESEKSPGLALGLSIGVPLAGYGLIAAAAAPSGNIRAWQTVAMASGIAVALVGPSSGHFYAGDVGRGLAFSGGRVLLAVLGSMALAEGMAHEDMSEADYDKGTVKETTIEVALCGVGILAFSVWESIDTYYSTKRRHGRAVAIAPMTVRDRGGASVVGLSVAGMY